MKALLLALQFLPSILASVQAVETALHGAPGGTKKAVVMSAISAGAQAVGETVPDATVKTVSVLVDSVVSSLNQTGWFSSKQAPAPPAVKAAGL